MMMKICFFNLTSIDEEKRRCLLFVEATSRSEQLDKLSRVGIISFGMNYEQVQPNDDDIGPNAITCTQNTGKQINRNKVIEAENNDDTT